MSDDPEQRLTPLARHLDTDQLAALMALAAHLDTTTTSTEEQQA